MLNRPLFFQLLLCLCGVHQNPPPRNPPGPVVAFCPCCQRKWLYYFGGMASVNYAVPTLLLPNFPRVIGPISNQYANALTI